jgi:hypothetical protein
LKASYPARSASISACDIARAVSRALPGDPLSDFVRALDQPITPSAN